MLSTQIQTPVNFGFSFASAWVLWLLLVPVTLWLILRAQDARSSGSAHSSSLAGVFGAGARRLSDASTSRSRTTLALHCGGIACLVLAAADPRFGASTGATTNTKVDVIVCLDVSRSMLARDLTPNRLEAAKTAIEKLAATIEGRRSGDSLALVAFAGEARLLVPRTTDMRAYRQLLSLSAPESIRLGGTNLGAALRTALAALPQPASDPDTETPSAAILLVTDGEDHEGLGLEAAAECAARGVVVHCVGLGSTTGAKIALSNEDGETFLRDREQRDILSAMNPIELRALAEATGGVLLDDASADAALLRGYSQHVRSTTNSSSQREPARRYAWPLLLGVVLLLIELGWSTRGRR